MGKEVVCPMCERKFELEEDLKVGDTTSCPGCYGEVKIASLNPPKLEEVTSFSEDYDDDEEDNDE